MMYCHTIILSCVSVILARTVSSTESDSWNQIEEVNSTGNFAALTDKVFCQSKPEAGDVMEAIHNHGKVVACFFNSRSQEFNIEAFNGNLCSHLIYKFAKLDATKKSIEQMNETLSKVLYKKVTHLKKKYGHLKILIGVGGSREEDQMKFNEITKSSNRKEFTDNAILFLEKHKFDGLHLHWQYPNEFDKDTEGFVALAKELKNVFRSRDFLLTTTIGGRKTTIDEGYNVFELTWTFDLVFIFSYGYHDDKHQTGHQSPLYSKKLYDNTADILKYVLVEKKANPNSLVLGIPFYGDLYYLKNESSSEDGFDQSRENYSKKWGYGEICKNVLSDNGSGNESAVWKMFWDKTAKAAFGKSGNRWLTFTSPRAIYDKVELVNEWGMRGIMVSSIDYDDFLGHCTNNKSNYPLLKTVNYALAKKKNGPLFRLCDHFNNQTKEDNKFFKIFKINSSDVIAREGSHLDIHCVMEGNSINVTWYYGKNKKQIQENGTGRLNFKNDVQLSCRRFRRVLSVLTIKKFRLSDVGNYYFQAKFPNNGKSVEKEFEVSISGSDDDEDRWGWIAFLGLLLIIFCAILAKCLQKRFKSQKVLTEYEVRKFREGGFIRLLGTADVKTNEMDDLEMVAYDTTYEISEGDFQIETDNVLGSGAFGIVFRGKVFDTDVAIKTVKFNGDKESLLSMLSELKIMIHVQQHPNIINLIGAYTAKITTGVVYVFVELCPHGSLLNYLKSIRSQFTSLLKGGIYTDLLTEDENPNFITEEDLIIWAAQIARGLEYLKTKKIVHSDLAARNVLVFSKDSVKLTDFGLSRKLYIQNEYIYKKLDYHEAPLPWRWMALESLLYFEWSYESDVWSFGITMWEIFSLGQIPYSELSWTPNFTKMLENGQWLHKPPYATDCLYKIMTRCWNKDPKCRPTPNDLQEYFKNITKCFQENAA